MTRYITVYIFDEANGAFLYPYEAQESPLEPSVFIEPISSTRIAPPQRVDGRWPFWADGGWELREIPAQP